MTKVISVLTFKSVETILRNGGTQSWALDPNRARSCKFAVVCRNARTRNAQGPEQHGTAFLIGRISGVVPSTETAGRWLITFSDYAVVNWPEQWSGRNPVAYWSTEQYDAVRDFEEIDFQPMPNFQATSSQTQITLTLPPALDDWMDAQVASGHFIDRVDYIRDLIRRDQLRSEGSNIDKVG